MSPTQRSLEEIRRRGGVAQVVERWNQFAKIKQDLFGCIDIVALMDGKIYGIQATSGSHHAHRMQKTADEPRSKRWVECGGRVEVWSWSERVSKKVNKDGTKSRRKEWVLRAEAVHGE